MGGPLRIVHTSDWHAGRIWKQISRLDELAAVLDHLARFVERERVDLVLVTGDVFDTGSPSAAAEQVVFEHFKRLGRAGASTVVIAGNHDNPLRLQAWGSLAELVGVTTVGLPRGAGRGGVIDVGSRGGEVARVAALPFAPPRSLLSALELGGDEREVAESYAGRMARLMERLASRFSPDRVNLLLVHALVTGATFAGSERKVHLGDDWAVPAATIPASAQYTALGHLHRPQELRGTPPIAYAGSPMQLDFGEEGERKSFVLVEAAPGKPVRTERVAHEGALPLRTVRASMSGIREQAAELQGAGWLRVVVAQSDPASRETALDANREVRKLLPRSVSVTMEALPAIEDPAVAPPLEGSPADAYRSYHRAVHGDEPSPLLMEAFERLRREAEGAA